MPAALVWPLIQAFLANLPLVFKWLISIENNRLVTQGDDKGRAEAVAEALTESMRQLDEAAKARAEAEADHAKHPDDDGGFDPEFRRGA